ncbi:MAG: hypothetical protein M1819_000497 [Sarea resinae]|nr:MAG: hypothetical protein M1819_000497 [Sarea resinae]
MGQFIYLRLKGIVYFASCRTDDDETVLELLTRRLAAASPESSFIALHSSTSLQWHQQDDVVNPFAAVWIVDLDYDILELRKKDERRRIALGRVRQGLPSSIADLELHDPLPSRRHVMHLWLSNPTWNPKCDATARQKAFTARMLEDFSHQWRHISRSQYNTHTFQKLANAILRIATLDFSVVEVASSRSSTPGVLVELKDLPFWGPPQGQIFRCGRVYVVLLQHLERVLPTINGDLRSRILTHSSHPTRDDMQSITYLVLTIREILLLKTDTADTANTVEDRLLTYTNPVAFLDGIHSPSEKALEYLLMANPTCSHSSIHELPLEIQDLILSALSIGPIEAARVGCILDLGSSFEWKTGGHAIER